MKKISILHPSRSRPEQSRKTIDRWIERAGFEVEVIISLDVDDPLHGEYSFNMPSGEVILVQANRSCIDAINNAANIATGDIFIVVSDDTDCPWNWAGKILTIADNLEDFVIKFADGIQKEIVTMPVMDRKFYNRYGYVYNPIYPHSWADAELTEVAKRTKRLFKRLDIEFTHKHYSVLGIEPDALYKRNDATHDPGREIFKKRQKQNFGL